MSKRFLAAIGAPILLAGTMLAGSAGIGGSQVVSTVPSDHIVFHGTLRLFPSAQNPTTFVIIQDQPALSTRTCSLTSDGEATVACQSTAHGTVSHGILSGSATIISSDGVIQLNGSVPIGGTGTITGKEIDSDGSVTTGISVTGHASVSTDNAGVTHISADYSVNEVPSPGDTDSNR